MIRRLVPQPVWDRMRFVADAEEAILCFLIYLIPGLPKDLACYLFGLSPIPFGVFAGASTLGCIPGTWMLSAQGAKTAAGQYFELALLAALGAAVAVPLCAYRHRLVAWAAGSRIRQPRERRRREETSRRGPGG